jgi:hypothetical protein
MFILCPQCQFLVAIDAASGLPPERCPRCGQALRGDDASNTSRAEEAAEPVLDATPRPDPAPDTTLDADVLGEAIVQSAPMDAELASAVSAAVPVSPPSENVAEPAFEASSGDPVPVATETVAVPVAPAPARTRRTATPSFVRMPHAVTARPQRWPTAATLAGLALLLVLQLLLADRAHLAADARWRPTLATLCGALRCTLPAWHEPDAFTLVARDVRPLRPGVLHVSASFRNDARWTQAWPALHLALQDVDGRTVAARVLAPHEYLGRRETQNGLAPGQVGSVAFDVGEPAGTVVAFTFDFR